MADSNLGCGPRMVKYLVFFSNLIFFLSGFVLIIVGGIAQGFFKDNMEFFDGRYQTPAIGIIILGSIILVVAFFGCCGAYKENVYMLRIFSFLMIMILLLEFAAAITVAVMRPQIKQLVETNMNKSMTNYNSSSLVTRTWDDMQKKYRCCGTFNFTDWRDTDYGLNVTGVPDSCCKTYNPGCGRNKFPTIKTPIVATNSTTPAPSPITTEAPPTDIYIDGCYEALVDNARSKLGYIIGGIVLLAALQVIGIWMSCCLIRAVKERYEIL